MTVLTEQEGDVLVVSLNRPEADNRLDAATIEQLTGIFEGATPAEPAVIVLRSTGPDFSLGRQRGPANSSNPASITAEFERIQRLNEAVERCGAVTIAAVTGRAEGAGLSLAGRCDIVVVAEDARLSFPEIPHGIPPTIVLSHYRYVLPRSILGDLIYGGRVLDGREATQFGLAARCVPTEDTVDTAMSLAAQIAGYDRRSIALVKRYLAATETVSPVDAPRLGIALYAIEMADRLSAE
jgi:enoyl-CoA hydratase/carnithine racemase